MLVWIVIAIIFIWLIVLSVMIAGLNEILRNYDELLYILRNDINELRFGKDDKI